VNPTKLVWRLFDEVTRTHVLLYRATDGLIGGRIPLGAGMLLVDHVGAKSGKKRTTPLVYIPDGKNYVIVASKGGAPRNPSWFHNLRANPDTTLQVGAKKIPVTAKVATPAQRKRLWPKVVDAYGGYAGYQRRTEREIPLVILKPR
jgi:deazaflavin-dependent oxidoreductase (nitroreductase family)